MIMESWYNTPPTRGVSGALRLDGTDVSSMGSQAGFFDVDDRLKRLSDLGDEFEAVQTAVNFRTLRRD